MKALAIFMTILMLLTGFDLCKSEDNYAGKKEIELSESGTEKHQEESSCAPFCQCARCPFSIMLPSSIKTLPVASLQLKKYDHYLAHPPVQPISPIWQPPKYS